MPAETEPPISAETAQRAFRDHLVKKATAARLKYGLYIDAAAIVQMLADPEVVRYPTTLVWDARPLMPHEFACPRPLGFHASDGFCLFVHPHFRTQQEILPLLVAYHIPVINYGDIIQPRDAELFGATLLGLDNDSYYQALCELADSMAAPRRH